MRGHALPNAAIPTVTIVGFMVGSLIAGAVVVESVFSWPGVGRLLVVAVANRDLAVVQCILLLVAITMVSANLIVDLLYGVLDPRLRSDADGRLHDRWPSSAARRRAARAPPPAGAAGERMPLLVWFALIWIGFMLLVALSADWITPYRFTASTCATGSSPPFHPLHWLGTDELGRDVLSRLIVSIRISLLIAFGATIISATLRHAAGLPRRAFPRLGRAVRADAGGFPGQRCPS